MRRIWTIPAFGLTLAAVLLILAFRLLNVPEENSAEQTAVQMPPAAEETVLPETPTPEPTPGESEIRYVSYDTVDIRTGEKVTKQMAVYLPAGYEEDGAYNALFLLHVAGCDASFWPNLGVQALFDRVIGSGACEPLVVFMPDGYIRPEARGEHNSDRDYPQFAAEFRDDLIPFVKANFALYEEREHYGVLGASFGAYMTVNSVLIPNLDLASWFGYVGGGTIDANRLRRGWEEAETEELPISHFYLGEGEYDDIGPVQISYQTLLAGCDKLDESNLTLSIIADAGHDKTEWLTGIEEALRIFYKE